MKPPYVVLRRTAKRRHRLVYNRVDSIGSGAAPHVDTMKKATIMIAGRLVNKPQTQEYPGASRPVKKPMIKYAAIAIKNAARRVLGVKTSPIIGPKTIVQADSTPKKLEMIRLIIFRYLFSTVPSW